MSEEQTPKHQPEPTHEPATGKGEEKTRHEGKEAGRKSAGTKGAGRPAGKSTARASTGINADKENPVDPESPHAPAP